MWDRLQQSSVIVMGFAAMCWIIHGLVTPTTMRGVIVSVSAVALLTIGILAMERTGR